LKRTERSGNILVISGVDPTGEAGLFLDVSCIVNEGFSPCGIPTAVVAENSMTVRGLDPTDGQIFRDSLYLIFEELEISATKIGLLPEELAPVLAETIRLNRERFGAIVLDPVISASSGFYFHEGISKDFLGLIELADVITPNAFEFEQIFGMPPSDRIEGIKLEENKFIVITGIPGNGEIQLKIFGKNYTAILNHERVDREVRGTGCAFSSILACRLALSENIEAAVRYSAEKMLELIKKSVPLGSGKYRLVF
jgi:hydroxymethylpyrimidine/phosphomethylpyrimidine kinase